MRRLAAATALLLASLVAAGGSVPSAAAPDGTFNGGSSISRASLLPDFPPETRAGDARWLRAAGRAPLPALRSG